MKIVALAGGVGGAKLCHGLAQAMPEEDLTVVVNTGDDFEFLGLKVCPDLDTVCYTLGGIANPKTGWGQVDETWHAMESLEVLGGPTWFRLGDRDLATHLERTRRLKAGEKLHQITRNFCRAWNIGSTVLPMSDQDVPTMVETEEGTLPFQEYFVRRNYQPKVKGFQFQDVEQASPAPGVEVSISKADLVVICPSNPWVSIDPILAVSPMAEQLKDKPVLAVSPIIGGEALKGPAAKMFREMGQEPSALAVAQHYGSLLNGIVIDERDQHTLGEFRAAFGGSLSVFSADTWMKTESDRARFASRVLAFGKSMR